MRRDPPDTNGKVPRRRLLQRADTLTGSAVSALAVGEAVEHPAERPQNKEETAYDVIVVGGVFQESRLRATAGGGRQPVCRALSWPSRDSRTLPLGRP
jgi:hypothetical protein